jgi:polysaccharide biosynthesis protein PslG
MGVPNTSSRLMMHRVRGSLLVALYLLGTLCGSANADSGLDQTTLDFRVGRQTMGFEYLRGASVLFGYGITADLIGQPITPLLNGAAAMRLNWIRQPVRWSDIEPERGSYSWELLDQVVSEVRLRGFHLLLAIDGTPAWARGDLAAGACDAPPIDPATFASFINRLSARYMGLVDAYQIWQSPNVGTFWNAQPSPQGYSQLLHVAYHSVKAVDPDALIVSADLDLGDLKSRPDSVDGLIFLGDMIQFGAVGTYDVLGLALDPSITSPVELLTRVRQVVAREGEAPIWITRVGLSCPLADSAATAACEEQQAEYLLDLAPRVERLPYIQAFMVDNLNLSIVDANQLVAEKSLMRSDWSPRPVFLAYARMRQEQVMLSETALISTAHNRASQSGPKPHHGVVKR